MEAKKKVSADGQDGLKWADMQSEWIDTSLLSQSEWIDASCLSQTGFKQADSQSEWTDTSCWS